MCLTVIPAAHRLATIVDARGLGPSGNRRARTKAPTGTRKSESVCAWSRISRCAGGLLELGSDFCDRDTLDPGALDCSEQEPLDGVPNGLGELLLVVLHCLVRCFVAILELDLGHQVHHEAPHRVSSCRFRGFRRALPRFAASSSLRLAAEG